MTKKAAARMLSLVRADIWMKAVRYDSNHLVRPFPEQRNGRLTREDVESARLHGIVSGIDAAASALGVKL
jgi:hypothetical protein